MEYENHTPEVQSEKHVKTAYTPNLTCFRTILLILASSLLYKISDNSSENMFLGQQRIGEKQWQKEMWKEHMESRTKSGSRSGHCFHRIFPNPEVVVHGWTTGRPWKPYYMCSAPAANGRRCLAAWVLPARYTTAFRSGEEPACLSACGKPGFWNTLS